MQLIENYEILGNEPMHDIAGHWKNLMEELPNYMSEETKKTFKAICSIGLNKDTKRAVDYRKTAINITLGESKFMSF